MTNTGAASLPASAGEPGGASLPDLDRLRAALRPAELPLPTPRETREAAGRVNDLLHAERYREARALVERFRDAPAAPEDRLALLRAALHGAVLAGVGEQVARDAADLVTLLRRSGNAGQAAAVLAVLLERGPFAQLASAGTRAATEEIPTGRGRHRGEAPQASAEMLVVVRALERSAVPGPRGTTADPRRDAARLRAALAALPAVRAQLLTDPEHELRLRLAQSLEGAGEAAAATTAALDLLELLADGADDAADPRTDPERLATAAHAVLARTLGVSHPLQAVHHALEALDAMPEIEDPPLRIGLITALLQALMAAGATREASFTAGRLASLQRTLGREVLRTAPLLAVAAQRVQAERYDAAWVPLEQARAIAREHRDRHGLLEVTRLAASVHERTGEHGSSLRELQQMAEQARWLADDLATPTSAQGELIRTELQANALAMRRALDLGRHGAVEGAVCAIQRRTRPGGGRPVLPAELLWDHRVDALMGRFLAAGAALARGAAGADEETCAHLLSEVRDAIDEVPPGHEGRARYWRVYLEDRHAHLLAERGRREPAHEAAHRAREGWQRLGSDADVARLDGLLRSLAGEGAGAG
ncbi:hypothetical protein CFK39_09615 [Brachybacterium avium]|uniref:Uncharacterized protein n=1 Tax=Brachybacterium avium TaxID=2017485 RepID=A0A220UD19_9MICO|nr:hypothetical protein [Brachybacterium avium]ASK66029.1 hypothetical protein CFK39_09615 [Brachybacterium avium]